MTIDFDKAHENAVLEATSAWTLDDAIATYLASMQKSGFVLAPLMATDDMNAAARDWSACVYGKPIGIDASRGCYSSMIGARPQKSAAKKIEDQQ